MRGHVHRPLLSPQRHVGRGQLLAAAREDARRREGQRKVIPQDAPPPVRWPHSAGSVGPQQPACRLGPGVPCKAATSPPLLPPPDFQPQVQSRLVGGSGVCAGSVEVRQGQGQQWEALCHSPSAKGAARWAEVCQEQQCGPVSSYQVLEAGEKDTRGLVCFGEKLSRCHQLQERRAHCKRVFLTCELATARQAEGRPGLPSRAQSGARFRRTGPPKRRWQMGAEGAGVLRRNEP